MTETVKAYIDGCYTELTRDADGKIIVPAGATVLSLPDLERAKDLVLPESLVRLWLDSARSVKGLVLPKGLKELILGGHWIYGEELERIKDEGHAMKFADEFARESYRRLGKKK